MAKKTKAQIEFEAVTSGFDDGIKSMDKSLGTLRKELRLNSTELKGNADDVDLLAKRKEILQRESEASAEKVELLSKKLIEAERLFGSNSKEVQLLNNKLLDAKNVFQSIQNETKQLNSSMDKTRTSTKEADGGFTVLKGTLADLASNAISGAISSIQNLISSLFNLGEATEEYRVMQAKLTGSSKTFGYSVDFANEKYEEFYRYLGDDQMATNAITNLMGLGTSTENISSIANGAIGVWASYGDSIPIESLTEAINETIQVGKVTGTFADTINWAKISNEEMANSLGVGSEAQKAFNKAIKDGETQEDAFSSALSATTNEQERADIVARFLNNTYGESKKTYDELTGSIQDANTAELNLKETQAIMAETIAPVKGAFDELKNDALMAMLPIVESISEAFMELKGWLDEHPVACDILKTVLITLTAVITTLTAVVVGWTVAQWALNSAILANPITWIVVAVVAGITAIIAIVVLLIKYWDEIVVAVKNAWSSVMGVLSTVGEWINTNLIQPVINFFKGLWDGIKAIWDGIVSAITFAFNLIVAIITTYFQLITLPFRFIWENCKDIIITVFNAIKDFISNIIEKVKNVIMTVFNFIKNYFVTVFNVYKTIFTNVFNAIKNVVSTVVNAIKSVITTVFNAIKNVITTIFNAIKSFASKVWEGIKTVIINPVKNAYETVKTTVGNIKDKVVNTFNTVKDKVTSIFKKVKDGITKPINEAKDKVRDIVDKIKGFFDFEFKLPKIKTPKFGITPKGWKIGDLLEGSIPKLSITWNKDGGIFNQPTIFNTRNGLQGVGEAGSEAILPLSKLEDWMNNGFNQMVNNNYYNSEKIDRLIEIVEDILDKPSDMYVDGKKVSEALAETNDNISGRRLNLKNRGVEV